jgi:uncharacterized membrane protein HdeD (DUF308 family)
MKTTNILYWIFTPLFALAMLGSAIPDIMSDPIAVQGMHKELGYPLYFIPFIGVLKALGVIAILVPGFHRIKEWAYAGFAFDLTGATYSVYAIGKPDWKYMLIGLAFFAFVYFLYVKRKKLMEQKGNVTRNNSSLVTSAIA